MEHIFSIHEPVRKIQIDLMVSSIGEFKSRSKDGEISKELSKIVKTAYACGFVCSDISPPDAKPLFEAVQRDPNIINEYSILGLRMYFHYLVRFDRHVTMDSAPEDGPLFEFLTGEPSDLFRERLDQIETA